MLVIAHRGASAYAPENTFAAFELALQMGAPALETDVQVTCDGVLVLLHDSRVDRTTNGQGAVSALTYAQVAALDAGAWRGHQFAGERIPRVTDFLDRYGKKVHYALEVKNGSIAAQLLGEVVARDLLEHVTFTSFSFAVCCEIVAAQANARVGFLYDHTSAPLIRAIKAAGLTQACPNAASLIPDDVAALKAAELNVRTWGVRNEELMRKVVELGVDGTTVDFPDKLLKLLN